MKYVTEGMEILLRYLKERGFGIQEFVDGDPHYRKRPPSIIRIYAQDNHAPFRKVTRKADCMCGKCEMTEVVKPGAYVNVCAFDISPSTIGVGFTEDANETWESYDLHEPDALKTIEERILWGLKDWTPEKSS